MKIHIIRHGETTSNLEKRIQGQLDTTLNARGEQQAEEVGKKLREDKIDAIFSSDLTRAYRTAEIIANDLIEVIALEGLRERHMGPIQGMLHADALIKRKKDNLPSLLCYGENSKELSERIVAAWNQVLELSKAKEYKTIAIVSHGSALHHLLDHLRKEPNYGYANSEVESRAKSHTKLGNCSVTTIEDNVFTAYALQLTESIVRERTLI